MFDHLGFAAMIWRRVSFVRSQSVWINIGNYNDNTYNYKDAFYNSKKKNCYLVNLYQIKEDDISNKIRKSEVFETINNNLINCK